MSDAMTSFTDEFVSSFVVSGCLASLGVQARVLQTSVVPIATRLLNAPDFILDDVSAMVTMLFVNLVIIFGPTYVTLSRGAANNPVVYVLKAMLGRCGKRRAGANALASIAAHIASLYALDRASTAFPQYFPGKAPVRALIPSGGFTRGALAEAAVTSANFIFAGLAEKTFSSPLLPAIGSGFYVLTMMMEGCKNSCGYMNPSPVIASHVVAGNVFSQEALDAIGTYVVGALLGCVITWLVAKATTPEPKSVRRQRSTSKAAQRSLSKRQQSARSKAKSPITDRS